jgi:DNA gyrase/topoisomerase IV subunit A
MTKNRDLFSSNIEKVSIGDFSEDAYLNYSMYVILDRALPSLLDGLKPVQRKNNLCHERIRIKTLYQT